MAHQHDHKSLYVKVWLTLCVLTAITVGAAYVNFGVFNAIIAMIIATTKALLVCWFFMHLKEDTVLNRFAFFSSLIFLVIFVGLTLADTDYRKDPLAKAKVTQVEAPAGNEAKQHELYKTANPELLAYGKTLFMTQCQTCHGAEGKGDGPAAAALEIKPRDFTSNYWKQGGAPSQVFQTITHGIPGSSMASFASLSVKDRWALTHFVHGISPSSPAETAESWNKSGLGNVAANGDANLPKLPIDMAMEILVKEAGNK